MDASYKNALHGLEAAGAGVVVSLPWWALQTEQFLVRFGAVCAALLAILRLAQLLIALWRRRALMPPIQNAEDD